MDAKSVSHQQSSLPDTLSTLVKHFLSKTPKTPSTIKSYSKHLNHFLRWSKMHSILKVDQIEESVIFRYENDILTMDPVTGKTLTKNSRYRRLRCICGFLCWLHDHHLIPLNPLEKNLKLTAFWQQPSLQKDSIFALAKKYFEWMQANDFTSETVRFYRYNLRSFIQWCHAHKIYMPCSVTEKAILQYQDFLPHDFSSKKNDIISPTVSSQRISVVSGFLGWLVDQNFLTPNSLARKKSDVKQFWAQTSSSLESLVVLAKKYFLFLQVRGYSFKSIKNYQDYLRYFIGWCHSYGIENATNVDRFLIERYQTYVYRRVHPQHQQQLSAHFRSALLIAVSRFFHWLTCENLLLYNPASEMQFPKVANRLPRTILNAQQAKQIMQQPNTSTPLGVRDRAILETLYSTAARRKELANLAIDDVSLDNATVFIKQGKGYKDRYLPLTPSSIHWLDIYLTHVRPALLKDREQKALFLHKLGGSFGLDNLGKLVRGYVKAANVGKTGSFLLFRHTVATLMLERGADLRYIQELLGHQNLETTQIYTRVSIGKLKEVHERTHPAKMKPTKTQQIIEELEDSD